MNARRFGGAGIRRRVRAPGGLSVNPTTIIKSKLLAWYHPGYAALQSWAAVTVGGAAVQPDLTGTVDVTLSATGGMNGGPYVRFTAASLNQMAFSGNLGGGTDRPQIYTQASYRNGASNNATAISVAGLTHLLSLRSSISAFLYRCASSTTTHNLTGSTVDTGWHVHSCGLDGTNLQAELDGVAETPLANAGSMDLSSVSSRIVLGGNTAGGGGIDVDLGHVVITSAALTAEEHADLTAWLQAA